MPAVAGIQHNGGDFARMLVVNGAQHGIHQLLHVHTGDEQLATMLADGVREDVAVVVDVKVLLTALDGDGVVSGTEVAEALAALFGDELVKLTCRFNAYVINALDSPNRPILFVSMSKGYQCHTQQ